MKVESRERAMRRGYRFAQMRNEELILRSYRPAGSEVIVRCTHSEVIIHCAHSEVIALRARKFAMRRGYRCDVEGLRGLNTDE